MAGEAHFVAFNHALASHAAWRTFKSKNSQNMRLQARARNLRRLEVRRYFASRTRAAYWARRVTRTEKSWHKADTKLTKVKLTVKNAFLHRGATTRAYYRALEAKTDAAKKMRKYKKADLAHLAAAKAAYAKNNRLHRKNWLAARRAYTIAYHAFRSANHKIRRAKGQVKYYAIIAKRTHSAYMKSLKVHTMRLTAMNRSRAAALKTHEEFMNLAKKHYASGNF
jgi:hypothetical protein